jgi:hypothetical protein
MAKLLLSLVLVATQLVSWSSARLYLCVCNRESVCIDRGPDDCDCCHESEAAPQDAIVAERGSMPALSLQATCECRHVELSLAGPATVVRTADRCESGEFIALPSPVNLLSAFITADDCLLQVPPGQSAAAIYTSAILGSVALRC